MRTSYFKIDRGLMSHWLWDDKPFARGQAWIDLIGLAYHKDHKTMINGEPIEVHRGEVRTSISFLAKRWGWSRDKVRRFLNILSTDGMITMPTPSPTGKPTAERTPIVIENYSSYQCDYTSTPTGKPTPKPTSDRQATDTNKKDKECIEKVVVDARAREDAAALSDRLTDEEWNRLDRQFDDFLPLIDRIDAQVVRADDITKPYTYILTAANRMNWPRKS